MMRTYAGHSTAEASNAPIVMTPQIAAVLQENNRQKYLSEHVRAPRAGETLSPGQWRNNFAILARRGVDILLLTSTRPSFRS